ncbi:histone-lysine N-methyltransferase SETD1B isoform X2 [Anguilla rostrata]|uniref:histone-lysine N-methyltransferase SETD1B isoform X2 n=1 Tax=Anguilla rostrata TaxID=7938 RepID=UPI0030D4AB9E
MGDNKMETLGKDTAQVECKQPDDNEGGIRRRLRDRDLLRKRRAEAEEKEIYQVQSKRQRGRPEGKTGPGRKGRPKKSETAVAPQPAQEGAPQDGSAEEEVQQGAVLSQTEEQLPWDPAQEEQPVISDPHQAEQPVTANIADVAEQLPTDTVEGAGESLPPPALPPTLPQPLGLLLPPPAPPAPEPRPEVIPFLAQEQAPPAETASVPPKDEVTIEDLGPDDEEAEPEPYPARELEPERGTEEEPGDNVTDSTGVFSISTLVSPPQPSYLPGPSL